MNRYLRALICVPTGILKICFTKLFHPINFKASLINAISPFTEISLDYGGRLLIGKKLKMRDGSKIRVRKGACCKIGKNTSVNTNNIIVCHEKIEIGDNVQLAPNVLIYDHDHDYKAEGGIGAMKYKTSPVIIGNNCWIGANTIILRGTTLGNNCVVGAGSVLKGNYPDGSVIIQKRETIVKNEDN